jgi:hypothetical protein
MRPDLLRPTLPLLLLLACQSGGTTSDVSTTGAASGTTDMSESTGSTAETGNPDTTTQSPTTTTTGTTADTGDTTGTTTGDAVVIDLDAPCALGPADPTRLALLTNNLMDPASVHVVDLATDELTAHIAPAPSDSALAWGDDKLVIIGRFGFNTLDVLEAGTWKAKPTVSVAIDGLDDANPQALAFGPDGRAYLTAFASAQIPVYDLDLPPADARVDTVSLADFADRDGSPEPGVAFTCGNVLFVGIQRLVDFTAVDLSYLVAVDTTTGQPIDADPQSEGDQAIALLGPWPKQVRLDPRDPTGHTVLVLTSGVERVDLSLGTSSWALDPTQLADAGIDGYDPIAFSVAADGASIHLLATDGDYPSAAVFHVGLDGQPPAAPQKVLSKLVARDRAIERIGTQLWVGDATMNDTRLRRLDISQTPPVEQAPLATPGDPYLLLAIP